MSVCAGCGEPVSVTDEGGCVGAGPTYHFRAECLLEAARRENSELERLREQLRYAIDAIEGRPWTGWSIDTAKDVLDA